MKKTVIYLAVTAGAVIALSGCGGSSAGDYQGDDTKSNFYTLNKQGGTNSHLFYGEVNEKSLGSLKNVIVASDINTTLDVRYPVVDSSYEKIENGYKNLYVKTLHYVSAGTAYSVDMNKSATLNAQVIESGLSNPSYTDVDYLGVKWYLTAQKDGNTTLITPQNSKVLFGNRKLLSVTYSSFGEAIDGYLVYNNDSNKIEKCSLDMSCTDVMSAGSRDFEGDILGTTYSVVYSNDKLYKIDKKDGSATEISLGGVSVASGHGTTSLQGNSFYFIGSDKNLYRVNIVDESVRKITPNSDDTLEGIRAFTDSYVIYGSDTILKAAKKDGSTTKPFTLIETGLTKGYKYVTNYGVGEDFLFVKYSVNKQTGHTTYQACIFNDGKVECKDNSFWAAVTIKKDGKRDYESSFTYTPYAYVRVDNTDDFGGGNLKAIDPKHPMDDGIKMGNVKNYNFQTFITNYRYKDTLVDSDGEVILYAKNDNNFHVDAFKMNLLKRDSLMQLTNTNPVNVAKGRDHCHGRVCMICHNLAGGKIYTDVNGTKSAYKHRVKLEFENGDTVLTDIAKGKGENFSTLLTNLTKGNFKAYVLDENNTVVKHSLGYNHKGVEAANCNYCHARGTTRNDAPGTISIK